MRQQIAQDEHRARQQGQILVLFALVLTVLLGMAGLAIDIAHARSVASDIQRAAEAGALAGVVFLPGNVSLAETQALTVTTQNGYTGTSTANPCPGAANTVCIGFNANAVQRQLQETITVQVPTFFLKVLGFNTIAVSKSATASYDDPIPLGAPDHMLGFAPFPTQAISSTVKFGQGFYLENRGPYTGLEHGDAFSPYFETMRGDSLLINSSSTLSGTYSGLSTGTYRLLDESSCAPYVPGSPTTACTAVNKHTGATSTVYLVNNIYYNQENQSNPSGFNGYNYEFSIPAHSPKVLLKILNIFDECAFQNTSKYISVYGPSGLPNSGGNPTAVVVSNEKIDQCDHPYFNNFQPTSLKFTIFAPASHPADIESVLTPSLGATSGVISDPLGHWIVDLGTHTSGSSTAANSNPQVFGADPASQWITHGWKWFTLAQVQNTSSQPEYVRVTVASVRNSDGTFGQGGHNFSLAICKKDGTTIGDPGNLLSFAAAYSGTARDNFYANQPQGTNSFYDQGCADPNWQVGSDGYGCPNVNGSPDHTCYHINALVAFCLETLQPSPGPAFIPIAAIDNSYAGSDLTLKLFDAGDIYGGTNVINMLGPNDDPANYIYKGPTSGPNPPSCSSAVCGLNFSEPLHLDISAPPWSGYSPAGQGRGPMSSWWTNDYSATSYPNNNGPINPPLTSAGTTSGQYVYPANSSNGNIFGNNTWLNMHILLPTNYNPPVTNQWWKVYYNLIGSGSDDTTTWEVESGSSPAHLINET